jgi:predicted kinase
MYEMTSFGNKWKGEYDVDDEFLVKHVERKIFEHFLQIREKVLIDNPSVTKSSRKNYLSIAEQRSNTIGVILLNTPLQKCLERNQGREDKIPNTTISDLYSKLESLEKDEGFEEILEINNY